MLIDCYKDSKNCFIRTVNKRKVLKNRSLKLMNFLGHNLEAISVY